MYDSGPLKVLGMIGAMNTLIENFPMSILDLAQGPTYTSIFEFLIDVLRECGISVYDVMSILIEKVFGVGVNLNGVDIATSIANAEIDQQSEFLESVEYGVKAILMTLLSSIFSCSAIPLIPTKYMDKGKRGVCLTCDCDGDTRAIEILEKYNKESPLLGNNFVIKIPYGLLNMFGHLNVNPCSNEGKMLFSVEGGDKYYQKIKITNTIDVPSIVEGGDNGHNSRLYLEFGANHANFLANKELQAKDELQLRLSETVFDDVKTIINYKDVNGVDSTKEITIKAGESVSEVFNLTAKIGDKEQDHITSITIDGDVDGLGSRMLGTTTCVYLDKTYSRDVINFWNKEGNGSINNIIWGEAHNFASDTESESLQVETYTYAEVGGPRDDAERVKVVPRGDDVNEDSPEFIVCYQGLNPNTLYKTYDMNAFLWYTYNRSLNTIQSEINKTMWDSRLYAQKFGDEREGPLAWNMWYLTKCGNEYEFPATDHLYPILQLYRRDDDNLGIKFPAQRYFKPNADPEEDDDIYYAFRLNSSMYQFNWEYLQSIRIFNPKQILYGMFDALLNGAISALLSIRLDLTRKETDMMLSNAIKKYIEAEDGEVEDCYFNFSNEEFDNMLRDMLLSRYNAVYNGGEENRANQINVMDYVNQIDSINLSSTLAGDTAKITKLVTDVSVEGGTEGSIDYGLEFSMDYGWWKRLIWAMALPIIKSLFTPQVILLFLINFKIMGITSLDDLFGNNQSAIIKLITNKIFGLIRSIISFIKDKLVEILLLIFKEQILPLIAKYQLIKYKEKIEAWLELLYSAVLCLPRFKLGRSIPIGRIDDVNYADIVNDQTRPESSEGC